MLGKLEAPRKGPGNARGGKAYSLPWSTGAALASVLNEALPVGDVAWETSPSVSGGNLSYLHKVIEQQDVYFFANSSNDPVNTTVRLKGKHRLERWDPHTGKIKAADCSETVINGKPACKVRLSLPPVHSVFLVTKSP